MRTSGTPVPRGAERSIRRFLLLFFVVYTVLHTLYMSVPNPVLRETVYPVGIVALAVYTIKTLRPHEPVSASGNKLVSPKGTLEIVRGCDGFGLLIILLSAMLALPSSTKERLFGLLYGLAFVYAMNELRVIGLYFVVAYRPGWFQPAHTFFIPSLMILAICVFFFWWTTRPFVKIQDRGVREPN